MEIIKTGAILEGFRTLSDGMIKISFAVEELDDVSGKALLGMRKQSGWLIFAPVQIEFENSEPPPEFKGDQSPSKRQRNLLYVWWSKLKEKNKTTADFETFRRIKMESIEGWIKNKIEELE